MNWAAISAILHLCSCMIGGRFSCHGPRAIRSLHGLCFFLLLDASKLMTCCAKVR
jgi:hypothetical protein